MKFSSGAGCKNRITSKSRYAGPVCCNGWFALDTFNVPDVGVRQGWLTYLPRGFISATGIS
jgi:hypothetical protein